MTYDEFLNFFNDFKKIKSFAGKIKFADQNLQRIGSGSGRIVYDIDGEKVLKLAKNTKGVAQNEVESGIGTRYDTQNIVTKVFEYDENGAWLISEKAKKVNEKRIKKLTGIPSLNDLFYYLKNFESQNKGGRAIFSQAPEIKEQLSEIEFVNDLLDLMNNYNVTSGDLSRPSTYGEVLRDGQPSIVVTDYGLSDEVYNSHYSPQRKQNYRLYELYQYADGNDDILSQADGGEDIRKSMWALIPYDVGDGAGVMNEDFIEFVSNRDYYPNKPLEAMPIMVERFHECVNNLKETLNKAPNKKKFYENLLKLQEYLIKQGFYDRDRLESETVSLNEDELKSASLNREYATQLADAFVKKMNLGGFKFLGGEGNGVAFQLNDGRVLKITTDVCEADAGMKISRVHQPKTIGGVYNVYKIHDTQQNKAAFILIEEFIGGQNPSEFHRLYNIPNKIREELSGDLMYLLVKKKTQKTSPIQGGLEVYPQLAQEILDGNPDAPVSPEDRKKAYDFFMGLYAIKNELIELEIKSNDFNNFNNLGYRNGVLTYFDVGGCFVPEPEFSPEDVIALPENAQQLDEDYDVDIANSIANQIATKLGVNNPKNIGSGKFGVAYDIGNDKILKITKDNSEAAENLYLIGKQLNYIAQPYGVFKVTSKNFEIPETYAIILEKLQTSPEIQRLYERIDFAFDKILDVGIPDVIEHYLGDWDNPYVDKNKINSYLKKNPQDAEFFGGLLRIAEETRELKIQSMDYLNWHNLGYKKNGVLAFFDVGFGNPSLEPHGAETIEVSEDSTSLYSTPTTVGRDDNPVYNQNNLPPSIDNDLDANTAMYEGKKSYMPNSKTVTVKKKCKLGGLGHTSVACNQGDISNLELGKINEGLIPQCRTFWAWVSPNNEFIEVPKLRHQDYIMNVYGDKGDLDYGEVFNQALKDGWVRVIFEYNPDRFMGSLSINGYDKSRVKSVFKEMFFDLVKYGYNVIYLQYENPEGVDSFSTRDAEGKAKMINYIFENINEDIDASEARDDESSLQTILNGKRNIALIGLSNPLIKEKVINAGLNIINVHQTDHPSSIETSIVYRDGHEKQANKLHDFMKSRGGYVNDRTPQEAYIIGKLLEYSDESILQYVNRIYKKLPNGGYVHRSDDELNKFNNQQITLIPSEDDVYKYYMNVDENEKSNIFVKNKIMTEVKLMSLQELPFKQEIQQLGGKIYSVGGAVRDEFLGKESKDLDILITGIPMDKLEQILSKYGRVDAVGKSFGILKFKPKGATEDIDIAIPRTEKPTGGGGHRGFEVSSDHALPIEKDLERRDFTINTIAKDIDGNIVDPYGGQKDLQDKIIRVVNPEAFSDDPLRMLRAVQFASRFGFTIEPETMKMIQDNAERIKEIPPERILTEFDKIVKGGNKLTGAFLLKQTGLLRNIFGKDLGILVGQNVWENVKTMGEFIYLLSHNLVENPAEFYKNRLKGDIDTYKEIRALQLAFESGEATNLVEARSIAHNMYVISPQSLQSNIIPKVIKTAAQELLSGKYPKTIGELAVNGNDLMSLGLQGKQIGNTLKMMLLKIYSGGVINKKEDLLALTSQNKKNLNESYLKHTWNVNGEDVDINFFIKKYDEWNHRGGGAGYTDPSKESVLEFLQNNYEDFSHDEVLNHELFWALTDREVLN